MYIGSLDSGRDYVRAGVSQARPRRTASLQERLLENGGSPRTRVGERRFSGVALGRTAVSRGFAWRTVVLPTSFSENRCSPITGLGWQVYLAPSTRISLTASWARPPPSASHTKAKKHGWSTTRGNWRTTERCWWNIKKEEGEGGRTGRRRRCGGFEVVRVGRPMRGDRRGRERAGGRSRWATSPGVYEKGLGWVGEEEMVASVCTLAVWPVWRQTSKPPADGEAGAGTGSLAETGLVTGGRSRERRETRPGRVGGKQ